MKEGWAEMFAGKGSTSWKGRRMAQESNGGMPCNPVLRWDQKVGLGPLRTCTVSSSLASWEEVL